MSAFLLNKRGMSVLADGLWKITNKKKILDVDVTCPTLEQILEDEKPENIFHMLNKLNARALYYKYGDPVEQNLYQKYDDIAEPYSKEQFLKTLHSFLYQCTEGPLPETSPLYQALDKLKKKLDSLIDTKSDAYDQAEWDY